MFVENSSNKYLLYVVKIMIVMLFEIQENS